MFIVGGFMLLSAVLMLALARTGKVKVGPAKDDALDGVGDLPQQ